MYTGDEVHWPGLARTRGDPLRVRQGSRHSPRCTIQWTRIQLGNPVVVKAVMDIGNNGLYDLLLSCWIRLGIGGEDGMEITSRDDDAPGG